MNFELEQYLTKFSLADGYRFNVLSSLFSRHVLFTPIVSSIDLGDQRQTKKFRVVTFYQGRQCLIPTFTSEDFFESWNATRYDCLCVVGGDLLLTLPSKTYLLVNPETPDAVELSPEDITRLVMLDSENQEGKETGLQNRNKTREKTDFSRVVSELSPSGNASVFFHGEVGKLASQVLVDLVLIFKRYPEIQEAYASDSDQGGRGMVLGLLTTPFFPERRFLLITEIAELSRQHYGLAGAIEVYDDLDEPYSNSWELFNTLAPFYTTAQYDEGEKHLSSMMLPHDPLYQREYNEDVPWIVGDKSLLESHEPTLPSPILPREKSVLPFHLFRRKKKLQLFK